MTKTPEKIRYGNLHAAKYDRASLVVDRDEDGSYSLYIDYNRTAIRAALKATFEYRFEWNPDRKIWKVDCPDEDIVSIMGHEFGHIMEPHEHGLHDVLDEHVEGAAIALAHDALEALPLAPALLLPEPVQVLALVRGRVLAGRLLELRAALLELGGPCRA